MANPTNVFRPMATGEPYPVKVFFALGNNALLSYPNQHQILKGLMRQELVVAHEIFMTPIAMLADHILPGDVFFERNHIADSWIWSNRLALSQAAVDAPPEAPSTFQFWCDLVHRFGLAEHFPWRSLDEILDHRLSRSGRTFAEFESETFMKAPTHVYGKYEQTGFATPTGKVELYSTVLDELGFDRLPYHREGPDVSETYPYRIFTGVREDSYFQTGQCNIESLRSRTPLPELFLHLAGGVREGLCDGDWARLETDTGSVTAKVSLQDSMKEGHVRVPHGWWYPELRGREALAGAFLSSDAVLCADDDEYLDDEQGVPHFKGFPGRVVKAGAPENVGAMALRA